MLQGFIDTQCGFKAFKRDAGRSIFAKAVVDRFSFDVEFLFIAQKHGLKIKEVPVEWENALTSRVSIVTDSARMFLDLFRIKFNGIKGLYD